MPITIILTLLLKYDNIRIEHVDYFKKYKVFKNNKHIFNIEYEDTWVKLEALNPNLDLFKFYPNLINLQTIFQIERVLYEVTKEIITIKNPNSNIELKIEVSFNYIIIAEMSS